MRPRTFLRWMILAAVVLGARASIHSCHVLSVPVLLVGGTSERSSVAGVFNVAGLNGSGVF